MSLAQQCRATLRDALGPFYKPHAAAAVELCESGSGGKERLAVTGLVLGMPDCKPLAGALVEVWQADARGDYTQVAAARPDDPRCLLRASIITDAEGRYRYTTILPGEYPGRPRHIHYRVSHKGHATLVTQLYFARERGIPEQLVVTPVRNERGASQASFDITLASVAR
jgi:protocatechuate 3,4-dioxygenase beta subunit